MTNQLEFFDSDQPPVVPPETIEPQFITPSQRSVIRSCFAELGISAAAMQFAAVLELTGQRIESVDELRFAQAQQLVYALAEKVRTIGRRNTGNAWDDREEETWIDGL